ncbi:DUF4265 domain-containing protein [Streptomyces sp. NPDC002888]|uniref:DUF4265 domain-containing protein n=1 Tax=Streptomyces sp. NPDC002888 TaxID=3364668 RepID=UPI0036A22397
MRLDNIPWFVRGVACGDVVATEPDGEGVRWAGEVVRRSENCTIRLIVFRDGGSGAARQSVIHAFHELGVCGEGIERFGMVALDVPPSADLAKVQQLLNHGVAKEWWDMEEGCVTTTTTRRCPPLLNRENAGRQDPRQDPGQEEVEIVIMPPT